jgi:hypothetical protein
LHELIKLCKPFHDTRCEDATCQAKVNKTNALTTRNQLIEHANDALSFVLALTPAYPCFNLLHHNNEKSVSSCKDDFKAINGSYGYFLTAGE